MRRSLLTRLASFAIVTLSVAFALGLSVGANASALRASLNTIGNTSRSFNVSADGSTFLKDGVPHRILSAGFHYFRCPAEEWEERLLTIKAAGAVNTIQTYVAWNFHCPDSEDQCDFTGDKDIVAFINLCQKHGFDVLLRPGPYICAEWEFGGFPAWITAKNSSIRLRSSDPQFLAYVGRWYRRFLPMVTSLMHVNGGNILMVQVENEYGSFTLIPDYPYLHFLRDTTREIVGDNVLLYSTDPAVSIDTSTIGGVFQAIDFLYWGEWLTNVTWWWEQQQHAMERPNWIGEKSIKGPPMNDEFYPGWLSQWHDPFVFSHTTEYVSKLVTEMMIDPSSIYSAHSNVNFYMFFGGTNFGFWNGGSVTTSYDYGAPVNESGHPINKFYDLQQNVFPQISGLNGNNNSPTPLPNTPLPTYYGQVDFAASDILPLFAPSSSSSSLSSTLDLITAKTFTDTPLPLSMEVMGQSYGYVYYDIPIVASNSSAKNSAITLTSITLLAQDYGIVYLDGTFIGHVITVNGVGNTSVNVPVQNGKVPQTVSVLVENTGRVNTFLPSQEVWKGIRNPLLFIYSDGSEALSTASTSRSLPMKYENIAKLWSSSSPKSSSSAATSSGVTDPSTPTTVGYFARSFINIGTVEGSTLLDMRNFGKGFVFVNGRNIGRFFSIAGPQYSLFVPKSYLKQGMNEIIVFEQTQQFPQGGAPTSVPSIVLSNVNFNIKKDTDPRQMTAAGQLPSRRSKAGRSVLDRQL